MSGKWKPFSKSYGSISEVCDIYNELGGKISLKAIMLLEA